MTLMDSVGAQLAEPPSNVWPWLRRYSIAVACRGGSMQGHGRPKASVSAQVVELSTTVLAGSDGKLTAAAAQP